MLPVFFLFRDAIIGIANRLISFSANEGLTFFNIPLIASHFFVLTPDTQISFQSIKHVLFCFAK
jgi:hypothetical protein